MHEEHTSFPDLQPRNTLNFSSTIAASVFHNFFYPIAEHSAVLTAHRQGRLAAAEKVAIGPALVFERLWRELGFPLLFAQLVWDRKFEFDVERAVFLTVLHRLFAPGSDRAAEVWRRR
jgi:hypothetical protein